MAQSAPHGYRLARRVAPIHSRALERLEQPDLLEHPLARWLQDKSGSYRQKFRRAFEEFYLMTVASQQQRRCGACAAATDYTHPLGDVHLVHFDLSCLHPDLSTVGVGDPSTRPYGVSTGHHQYEAQ